MMLLLYIAIHDQNIEPRAAMYIDIKLGIVYL